MDIVLIFGPQAVGKMTVGEELEKQTKLPLLHNHMTIDLVLRFMPWEEGIDLILDIREEIMKRVAKGNSLGMIMTFVWSFDSKLDWEYVENIRNIFKGHNLYFVELNTDLETRQLRNVSENRLNKKWTKRNIEWSQNELLESLKKHRMTSKEGEVSFDNYLRIDNTNLSPLETANKIIDNFRLKRVD